MELLFALAGLALAHLVAVISPGPSLVVVTRTSIAVSRSAGLWTALGFGVGSLVWATCAIFGLDLLFSAVPWLYWGMKFAGALYLIYLAISLWRRAGEPNHVEEPKDHHRETGWISFRRGLLVQLSNPKVVVFMGSILVTLLPATLEPATVAAVLAIVFLNEFVWYAFVACAFSVDRIRSAHARAKRWIDRVAGTFLATIGVRLIVDR